MSMRTGLLPSLSAVRPLTCPEGTVADNGEAHTIIGCGSTNIVLDSDGQFDCGECGIFWIERLEGRHGVAPTG